MGKARDPLFACEDDLIRKYRTDASRQVRTLSWNVRGQTSGSDGMRPQSPKRHRSRQHRSWSKIGKENNLVSKQVGASRRQSAELCAPLVFLIV